jgi:SAM-dependent methyltransferase
MHFFFKWLSNKRRRWNIGRFISGDVRENPILGNLIAKLTKKDLHRFMAENASDKNTLVVHCGDAPFQKFFPNRIRVNELPGNDVDIVALACGLPFKSESFGVLVCTGLLEHLAEPREALSEMKRVLRSRGTLLLSASSTFSTHNAPHDYYRYTVYGMRYLLRDWSEVEARGSCDTMTTFAILLQRLGYQTSMPRILKVFLFIFARILPRFQFILGTEFGDIRKTVPIKSILSSNVQAVATK